MTARGLRFFAGLAVCLVLPPLTALAEDAPVVEAGAPAAASPTEAAKVPAVESTPVAASSPAATPVAAEAPKTPEDAKVDAVIEASKAEPEATPVTIPPKSKKPTSKSPVSKTAKQVPAKPVTVVAKAKKDVVKPDPVPPRSTKPLSAFELGRYQYCGEDRDCMHAVNGCCDCANGGEDVAVNRQRYEAFRDRFQCLHVSCGDKTLQPECATGLVSCLNHKCRYFRSDGLEDKF